MSYSSITLSKILLIQNQSKPLKACCYMVKTTLVVYFHFYKLIFFETTFIILEPTIKLITGIFDLQISNNSYQDNTSVYFQCAFRRRPTP